MKNKRFKKVLSVFLSILMIMSAWVWVAPTEASAAGSYYVRVYVNIYDGANSDGYGNPYTVVTDPSSEFYGKPDGYKWDYGSSWNAFDNSAGYDGEVNMAGFTLFYDNDNKYETYDLSADLVAATTTLGNNWTSMDDLTLENFASWPNKVEKVYAFELDSMPSSLFWINDENNAVNGETSFGFHKITVAESSTGTEHIIWSGLSGSESYYECYYGTVTPTGIITPWDDCPGEDEKSFYKDYTTSAVGTWIDPFNAGDYNVYPVNNYLSGGVSASFTVGNSGSQTNIDYVDVGNTNNYYINFTNHSTQEATVTLFKANNKSLVSGYSDGFTLASGQTKSFLLNKGSMSGDGSYYDFSFKFKLDNVYNSDGTTQTDFYQAAGIGTWNTADDSSEVGLPAGETANKGFTLYNGSDIDVMNQFMSDIGIFETVSTTGNRTSNATFEYNYWVDTSSASTWQDVGLRMYAEKWSYYRLHLQPSGTTGTINITGDMANTGTVSISMADLLLTYNKADINEPDKSNRPWAYYNTPCTPYWEGVTENKWGTLWNDETPAYFPFCGEIIKGSTTSTNPGKIVFNNMTWRCPGTVSTNNAYFSGTINVYSFDKTQLRNYVYSLGGLGANWAPMRTRFNDTQWNAYEIALKDAKEVLANQKTNQKAVTDAYNTLYSATEALKETSSLKSQVAEVTYTQRETDYDSAVVSGKELSKYIIMPIGTETAVPAYDTFKYATVDNTVGKQSSNLKTNYTQYDIGINPIDYRYWKIDFTGVDEAISKATSLLDSPLDTYSDAYYEKLFDARTSVSYFDRDADTWTPTHQSDVSDPLAELNALLSHADDNYDACIYDGDDEDTEPDIVNENYNCIDGGTVEHVCIICGKVQVVEEKAPQEGGHSYTYTNNGDSTHTANCSACGATETVEHTFTNPVLTRPTQNDDGTWTDGTYTYTCVCGKIKTETTARAEYTKIEEAVVALEKLNEDENLTDDAKDEIAEALAKAEALPKDLVTAEQSQINDLLKELQDVKADVEKIISEEIGTHPVADANSGIKVQFLKKTGVEAVDFVQLNSNGGFETARMKLTNGNADLPITVTRVTADKAYIGADENASSLVYDTATVLDKNGDSKDFYIVAPSDFNTSGIITYTITYYIGSDTEGYLLGADGKPVEFQTEAYLYVKGVAVTPYHLMDETCNNGNATAKWAHTLESSIGDFEIVYNNKAPNVGFDGVYFEKDDNGWLDVVNDRYDYENDKCFAGCTGTGDTPYVKGDAHAATYKYYIDTSLAPTWQDAGFKVAIAETAASVYDNAALKYIRLANNQAYLDAISGDNKTFTVTLVPGASSNVPTKTWTATSSGDLTVSHYQNANEDEYVFGNYLDEAQDIYTAYENFTGYIPQKTEDAKMMFSTRMEYNMAGGTLGTGQAEATTMTTHLYITSYDKSELRDTVNAAEQAGYNEEYYDTAKWDAYEAALKSAKEVLGKAETTQTEVDKATEALQKAIADLTATESEAKFVLTVTHSIHENADKNSEATSTEYDYYLVANNGSVTPALKTDIINLDTINKYDNVVDLTITEDTEHTYNYWYIDYSAVQDAIDAADEIIKNADDYSENFIQEVTEKKEALEAIKNNESSTTVPESQSEVDNAIDAVTDLTGHKHAAGSVVVENENKPKCEEPGSYDNVTYCTECGKELSRDTVTVDATNHNYDIANAELIARPELVDGVWTDGKYEATCLNDESHKLPLEGVKRADYSAFDAVVAALKELAKDEDLTNANKQTLLDMATQLENGTFDSNDDGKPEIPLDYVADYTYGDVTIPGEQVALNEIVAELEAYVAEISESIEADDPNLIKPDFSAAIAEWEEYLALVEQYGGEVTYGTEGDSTTATVEKDGYIKDSTNTEVTNGFAYLLENVYNSDSATEADWKDAIAQMTSELSVINKGIKDGTLRDPNFEAFDAAVKLYDEETSTVNVSAEDAQKVAEAKAIVEAIRANADATAADSDAKIAEQTAIIEAINEKYAVCVEGTHDYGDATCTEAKTCKLCGATSGEGNGHNWGEGWKLTIAPTAEAAGEYTRTCVSCRESETKTVERENYSSYDKALEEANKLLGDDTLTEAAKEEIRDAIAKAEKLDQNLPSDVIEDGETVIDNDSVEKISDATKELTDVLDKITNDETGTYLEPDYNAWKTAEDAYDALDKTNVKPGIITEANNLKNNIAELQADDTLTQATATQDDIDAATNRLNKIIAGIEDGSLKDPDYTGVKKALEEAKEKAEKGDVTDETSARIEEIEETIKQLEEDPDTNANDQETIDNLKTELEEIIDAIDNGSAIKPDYTDAEKAIENAEKIGTLTAEEKQTIENLKQQLEDIKRKTNPEANAKDDQDDVDAIEKDAQAIINKYADCENGNHAWDAGVLTRPIQNEDGTWTDGYYTYTCGVCGETKTEPAERADYTAYDAAVENLNNLLSDENLTAEANDIISEALSDNSIADDLIRTEQDDVDAAADALNSVLDTIKNDTTGAYEKPYYDDAEQAITDAETHGVLLSPEEVTKLEELRNELQAIMDKTNPEATVKDDQDDIDAIRDAATEIYNKYVACAEGNHDWTEWVLTLKPTATEAGKYESTCNVCGTTTFRYVARENYTDYDAAVERAETMLENSKYTPAAMAIIEAALNEAKTLDQQLPKDLYDYNGTTKLLDNNNDVLIKEVTDKLNAVLDSIANDMTGAYENPNYTDAEEAIKDAESVPGLTEEDKAALKELKKDLEEIKKDPTSNKKDDQDDVDAIEDAAKDIIEKYDSCSHIGTDKQVISNLDGTHSLKCLACGEIAETVSCTYTETVVEATCQSVGYTLHACKVCTYSYRDNENGPTEHNWSRWFINEGNCKEVSTQTRYCDNNGCYAQETVECIDANGNKIYGPHVLVIVDGKPASCTNEGHSDYSRCIVCDEITESKVIPATGHIDNNKNGNCDVCNYLMNPSGNCGCFCHNDSFFGRLLYNFVNFFWKLFKINRNCECGENHW